MGGDAEEEAAAVAEMALHLDELKQQPVQQQVSPWKAQTNISNNPNMGYAAQQQTPMRNQNNRKYKFNKHNLQVLKVLI